MERWKKTANSQKKSWYSYPYTQKASYPLFCLKKAFSIIIREVLSVALRYGNYKFGNKWTFQQDNGTAHTRDRRDYEKLSRQVPSGAVQRACPVLSHPAERFSSLSRPASHQKFPNPVPHPIKNFLIPSRIPSKIS